MSGKGVGRICAECGRPLEDTAFKTLLNPITMIYTFRPNFLNWCNQPIMDQLGNIIGAVRTLNDYSQVSIYERDGTPILSIRKKFLRAKYDLFDGDKNLIARIQVKSSTSKQQMSLMLPSSLDKAILLCNAPSDRTDSFTWDIISDSGESIAEIRPAYALPEILSNIIFSFGDAYYVKILSSSVDRRFILGFVGVNEWEIHNWGNSRGGFETFRLQKPQTGLIK